VSERKALGVAAAQAAAFRLARQHLAGRSAEAFALHGRGGRSAKALVPARCQARLKITPAHVRMMMDTVLDGPSDGALTQPELIARAMTPHKGMRAWLDHAWSAVRPAAIEGAIVYGPPRGAAARFARADPWLGTQAAVTVDAARPSWTSSCSNGHQSPSAARSRKRPRR
jgi:hypothetical protein